MGTSFLLSKQGAAAARQEKLDKQARQNRVAAALAHELQNGTEIVSSLFSEGEIKSEDQEPGSGGLSQNTQSTQNSDHLTEVSAWIPGFSQTYELLGVRLYPWQVECMIQATRFGSRNLLVSAPTSSGKTLVGHG